MPYFHIRHSTGIPAGEARIQSKQGKWDDAIASRRRSIAILTELSKALPDNVAIHAKLAADYQRVAEWQNKKGQHESAVQTFKAGIQALEFRPWNSGPGIQALEEFLEREPNVAEILKLQTIFRFQLGQTYQEMRDYEAAVVEYALAAEIGQKAIDSGGNDSQTRINIAMAQHYATQTKLISEKILGDWDRLMQQPHGELPAMLNFRADEFIHRQQLSAAAQAARKVRDIESANPVELYNSACHLCRCAASIQEAVDTPTIAIQKEAWIADAISSLKKAIDAGYDDFDHMQKDEDLKMLQNLPGFKALIPKSD